MSDQDKDNGGEIPLSWFGKTLWKFTPLYGELVFLAICLRLIGLVEPFIFQVIIDRILPFQREASLIVVVAIFMAVSLFQIGFEVLAQVLGMLTANQVTREFGARISTICSSCRSAIFANGRWARLSRGSARPTLSVPSSSAQLQVSFSISCSSSFTWAYC